MVNFGLNSASVLGIFLAVAGASLYFMRSMRPELSRDQDIFFAAVGLLCGFILLFQGWRLDPILQFGQFLLTAVSVAFAVETIRLRGVATEQAKRDTPIVDDERPTSKVYRAELDELEPEEEEEEISPRLRGARDSRSKRTEGYEYDTETRRMPTRSRSERYDSGEQPRKRRPRPSSSEWYENERESRDDFEERPHSSRRSRSPRRSRPESYTSDAPPRPKRSRPRPSDERMASPRRESRRATGDYVDYQPVGNAYYDDASDDLGDSEY